MANGATLENWVKDIDVKVDGIGQSIVRIETHLDSGHITSAQNREDIGQLQEVVKKVREDYIFLKGQMAAIKWIGGLGVGLAIILQALKMWTG